jgi:hypothetical protein
MMVYWCKRYTDCSRGPCHRSKRQTSDDSSFLDEGPVNGQFTEPGKSRGSSNIDYYDVNTPGLSHLNVVNGADTIVFNGRPLRC